jgi:DNA-directed RNA polymerase specialized sigma24 family protein
MKQQSGSGAMDSFKTMLIAEIRGLRRYARARTRNEALADDLVQITLEKALSKAHLFEPNTNLRACSSRS